MTGTCLAVATTKVSICCLLTTDILLPQPQSLSRADSGMVFGGSRAETPEPDQSVNNDVSI